VSIRSILLKNGEGIRVLGNKVFVDFFDFSKCKMFEYFFEYFRILWDTLEYFEILLWNTILEYFAEYL